MLTYKKLLTLALLVALLVVSVLPAAAAERSTPAAATYRTNAVKVHINLLSRHDNYGIFLVPSGYQDGSLQLHFMDQRTGFIVWNAGGPCGAAGPGSYLEGVYVPRGYTGVKACMHTTVANLLYWSAERSALYNSSAWVLQYTR